MKIENMKINAYGNLQEKDIELSDGINIIYGKNEAGKSTLLKFMINSFYGTSKNKKGREFSDYDRYKPWGKDDFSGKIKYKLDNGEEFEVFREFGKKNPKIFNSNMEDVSKQFTIDRNLGNQFFYEQTKIDEDTFLSTIASMQQEVKLEKSSQNILVQKIANIAVSGEDNISYQKASDKLYKRQLEEVGTYRSQGKPINVVQNRLNDLKNKRHELGNYRNIKFDFDERKNIVEDEIVQEQMKIEFLKSIKSIDDNMAVQSEKVNYNLDIIKKDEKEIFELIKEKNKILADNNINSETELVEEFNKKFNAIEPVKEIEENPIKIGYLKYIILFIMITIINAVIICLCKNPLLKCCGLPLYFLILIVFLLEKKKIRDEKSIEKNKMVLNRKLEENRKLDEFEKNKKILEEINIVNAKIEVFENDKREQLQIIEELKNKLKSLNDIEKEKVKNSFRDRMDVYEINKLLNINDINEKIEEIISKINDKKVELHRIELSKNNIMPQLEDLVRIEESIIASEEEYNEIIQKNNAMTVVKQVLDDAYENMKNNVTPKFTESLSQNINSISNGKYNKVSVNDDNGLMVELSSGDYVSAERLSLGTIDQLYLSLRLSMSDEVSTEVMPIILDEAFAYYDEERLENILRYLVEKSSEKQVIIFTCTNREENILNRIGCEYNKVSLS